MTPPVTGPPYHYPPEAEKRVKLAKNKYIDMQSFRGLFKPQRYKYFFSVLKKNQINQKTCPSTFQDSIPFLYHINRIITCPKHIDDQLINKQ